MTMEEQFKEWLEREFKISQSTAKPSVLAEFIAIKWSVWKPAYEAALSTFRAQQQSSGVVLDEAGMPMLVGASEE